MRNGDFGIEVVPDGQGHGRVRELANGQVLARPGQVYRLRLRNYGPLYCVVQVEIDGRGVTGGGLVLEPWGTTELERPVHETENGRFTVFAEGNETVFGPDGGRDNHALGLIEASFRRELPRGTSARELPPTLYEPREPAPPFEISDMPRAPGRTPPVRTAFRTAPISPSRASRIDDAVERAAGTGLTGRSDQRFTPFHLGELEREATVLRLRIVIGSEAAIAESAPVESDAPGRPAARP